MFKKLTTLFFFQPWRVQRPTPTTGTKTESVTALTTTVMLAGTAIPSATRRITTSMAREAQLHEAETPLTTTASPIRVQYSHREHHLSPNQRSVRDVKQSWQQHLLQRWNKRV